MPAAPWIAAVAIATLLLLSFKHFDTTTQNLTNRFAAPSRDYLLGTDHLGRDTFARLLAGAKYSVGLAVVLSVACAAFGTSIGVLAGWLGGTLGAGVDRIVDSLVAIPAIIFGLVLTAVMGPGIGAVVVAVSIAGWTPYARMARNLSRTALGSEYALAAMAYGQSGWPLLYKHIVPNIRGPLVTLMCMRCADVIFLIGGLSFLGIGIQLPIPEWGAMIADARPYLTHAPQLLIYPAVGLVTVVVALSVIGRNLQKGEHRHGF
ncbi:ABC transporter permease [Rhodococcoides kyotonense]|nr:ABC transporter permease [Rhodococcus kyotonensis]